MDTSHKTHNLVASFLAGGLAVWAIQRYLLSNKYYGTSEDKASNPDVSRPPTPEGAVLEVEEGKTEGNHEDRDFFLLDTTESYSAQSSSRRRRLLDDEVVSEQLTRNIQFFGPQAQEKISNAFVIVVGLGGVGSHAAHLLLRSGVGRLRLIDFDQVTVSSLNRHCLATRRDVGLPKTTCLERHFKEIMPEVQVDAKVKMYTKEAEEELLGPWRSSRGRRDNNEGRQEEEEQQPDYVFDAIDNIDTKVDLLVACKKRNIPVLMSAGAGAKADPTKLRFGDISEAGVDALGRSVRTRLKQRYNITAGIEVLLSTEKPRCGLVDVTTSEKEESTAHHPSSNTTETPKNNNNNNNNNNNKLKDYQVIPNFRVRTIPVLGTSPSIFGLAAAAKILTELAGPAEHGFNGEPISQYQGIQYKSLLESLYEREQLRYGDLRHCDVDIDDIIFLVRETWRGLSARKSSPDHPGFDATGRDKGKWRKTSDLAFTRWDPRKGARVDNLVLLTLDEADAHDEEGENVVERLKEEETVFYEWVTKQLNLTSRAFEGQLHG